MSSVRIMLVLSVVVAIAFDSAIALPERVAESNVAVQVMTDVVSVENGSADGNNKPVTPYGYKVALKQASGRKLDCWHCSPPCSHSFCCDDGFPQCCLFDHDCKCCRV